MMVAVYGMQDGMIMETGMIDLESIVEPFSDDPLRFQEPFDITDRAS
jgi:hypothetical protein